MDLPEKRKLAEYLISNDYNIYKRHLLEVQKLNDEEFNELFEGNTEYKNYTVSNLKNFIQLVQKFEDNQDLIMQWYNREEYYKFVSEIWKKNILAKLQEAEDNEKNIILKENNIDISKWNEEFREYFNEIIKRNPIKSYAERIKNYIKTDYGNFDELIKSVDICKDEMKKSEESICKRPMLSNIDSTMNKIINQFIPKYESELVNGFKEFKKEKEKKKEEIINREINAYTKKVKTNIDYNNIFHDNMNVESNFSGLSEKNKKKLTNEIKKLYSKDNKNSKLSETKKMEKLKDLGKQFNEEGEKFCQIGIKDQAKMLANNQQIKNAVLGLSMANMTYSYLHLGKTLTEFNQKFNDFRNEFTRIKNNFEQHKKEVELIPEDIDEAVKQIIETGKKFQQDLNAIQCLIQKIKEEINNQEKRKSEVKVNTIVSSIGILVGGGGSALADDSSEYNQSFFANVAAIVGNIIDLKLIDKNIKEYTELYGEAEKLMNEITQEIDKLRNKFNLLSTKHMS